MSRAAWAVEDRRKVGARGSNRTRVRRRRAATAKAASTRARYASHGLARLVPALPREAVRFGPMLTDRASPTPYDPNRYLEIVYQSILYRRQLKDHTSLPDNAANMSKQGRSHATGTAGLAPLRPIASACAGNAPCAHDLRKPFLQKGGLVVHALRPLRNARAGSIARTDEDRRRRRRGILAQSGAAYRARRTGARRLSQAPRRRPRQQTNLPRK